MRSGARTSAIQQALRERLAAGRAGIMKRRPLGPVVARRWPCSAGSGLAWSPGSCQRRRYAAAAPSGRSPGTRPTAAGWRQRSCAGVRRCSISGPPGVRPASMSCRCSTSSSVPGAERAGRCWAGDRPAGVRCGLSWGASRCRSRSDWRAGRNRAGAGTRQRQGGLPFSVLFDREGGWSERKLGRLQAQDLQHWRVWPEPREVLAEVEGPPRGRRPPRSRRCTLGQDHDLAGVARQAQRDELAHIV